ncbi:hypothetical protein AGMMS49546_11130 [Spirochaetia bacterium]|nr:hypothetical protein AGMMS49546_11130 [Spirochaetia bacterium]
MIDCIGKYDDMKKNQFLFACSFFFSIASNILSFSIVYLLTDRFAFNPGQVGSYAALGALSYFCGCNLYHRFGALGRPSRIISGAVIMAILSSIVLGHARDSRLVALSYFLIQGSAGLYWPPLMAWFTQGLDEMELNREISRFNRCWMTGTLLAPLIGGALYHWSSRLNFIAISAAFAVVFLILMLLQRRFRLNGDDKDGTPAVTANTAAAPSVSTEALPESAAEVPAHKPSAPRQNTVNTLQEKALSRYRLRGWVGALCANLFMGVLTNIVPLHIRDGLGYTERAAGLVLFFRGISALIGFAFFARFTFWHFNRRWFIFIQSALILCAILFITAGSHLYFYFFIIFFYGFFHSACYTNSIFHSSATGKNTRKNLALHEIFLSIGNAAGSAGGGFCYQHFGFLGTFIILTLVQGIGLAFFILLDYRGVADGSPRVRKGRMG